MANCRVIAAIVLVVVSLLAFVALILLYTLTGGEIPFDHGVILDAGSSHTEALLYQWQGDKFKGTGLVKELEACGVEDGISSFTVPEEAGASLIPCLQRVSSKIPEEKRSKTPVYLGATAGMRLLNMSNPYMNLATFTAIRCAIPQSGLKMEEVGIITGQDEGIFAWITTNFLLGYIQRKEHPTLGALDMGGASTQISFEVAEANKDLKHVRTLKLYGETYHVFSVTYLCYGAFEIYRRYQSQLITDLENTGPIESPCMNKGRSYEHDAKFLFAEPCTETTETIKHYFLNPEKLNTTYNFIGTSDFSQCQQEVAKLFNPEECVGKYKECFEPIGPIKMSEKFMALSSYAYTSLFLKANNDTMDEFRKKSMEHCMTDWAELQTRTYPNNVKKALARFCLQAVVVERILNFGYGFDESSWGNLQFATKVKDTSIGWALGYMINATNAIPEESAPDTAISTPLFVVLILFCLVLAGVGIFTGIRARKAKRMAPLP